MATVYSSNYSTGTYTYTRVKVEYSGTSATATLLYSRTNDYSGATSQYNATFTFGGKSTTWSKTFYGRQTDAVCASVTFSISGSGGTYSGTCTGTSPNYFAFDGSVTIPSQKPAKPTVSVANASTTSNTVTYGTTSFGNPSSGTVYLYGGTSSSPTTQIASKTSTGNSTYTHSSLTPNKKYYYRAIAKNGTFDSDYSSQADVVTKAATRTFSLSSNTTTQLVVANAAPSSDGGAYTRTEKYSFNGGSATTYTAGTNITKTGLTANTGYTFVPSVTTTAGTTTGSTYTFVTKAPAATVSVSDYTSSSITIKYSCTADGGKYAKTLQYSIDGGTTWKNGATISSGSAVSNKTFTISSLSSGTTYSIQTRMSTSAGTTSGSTLSQKTASTPATPTVSASATSTTSITVTYGLSSFGYPASGTLTLYWSSNNSTWTQAQQKTATGSYTFTHSSLSKNTKYYYKVTASNGKNSANSATVNATTYSSPTAPTISATVNSDTQITVTYGTTSFGTAGSGTVYLQQSTNNSTWTQIASKTTTGNSTKAVTGLTGNTKYYFKAYVVAGGETTSAATTNATTNVSYTAPTGVSGTINTNAAWGTASSTVNVAEWGVNSSAGTYIISKNGTTTNIYNSSTSSATVTWSIPNISTSTEAGIVNTWYAVAVNNHSLSKTSSAYYLVTPSAPALTYTGSTSTSPKLQIDAAVAYRGGSGSNSTTLDNADLSYYRFSYKTTDTTSWTNSDISSTSKAASKTFTNGIFAAGKNYDLRTFVRNIYGAYAYTSSTVYCPTGVSSSSTTSSAANAMTIKASYQYAGNINSQTTGSIACYSLKYSTDKSTVDGGGGTAMALQTSNTFNLTGLSPNTTYYYRITAYNTYGLSNVSSTLSAKTIARFTPTVGAISTTALSPGVSLTIPIAQTGGVTANELTVTSITVKGKLASASSWTTLRTDTGLSLVAGQTHTASDLLTADQSADGDYQLQVTASNGTDSGTETITIAAPPSVTITSSGLQTNWPTQIKVTATTTENSPYRWRLVNTTTNEPTDLYTTNKTVTLATHNHLDFQRQYSVQARCYNGYGLRKTSASASVTTDRRAYFYFVPKGKSAKNVTLAAYRRVSTTTDIAYDTVYFVKANALSYVTANQDLRNHKLTFITQPLHYRAENVASITFSNGKKLGYALHNDMYKFAIWNGNTPETVFFDGTTWQMSSYNIPDTTGYTVSSIAKPATGLNASAPFSTTVCEEVKPWETN